MRLLDLPPGVNGLTVLDDNGDYNVYINARISADERMRAFMHEWEHIRVGHFQSEDHAGALEDSLR